MSKRFVAIFMVMIFSINTFGAIVSDNDGSAFITKAEFDSLKNDFQSQIDNYNTSIDSKIDGAIAAYLAGIKLSKEESVNLLLWGGTTLGLVEDHRSHPYVEGCVGGRISFSSFADNIGGMINGTTSYNGQPSIQIGYVSCCLHELKNDGKDFAYLSANDGKINGNLIWDINGYGYVKENLDCNYQIKQIRDNTNVGSYSIGLCAGWDTSYGDPGGKTLKEQNKTLLSFCECSSGNETPLRIQIIGRGSTSDSVHNLYNINTNQSNLTSQFTLDRNMKFLTNADISQTYKDVFPTKWYGSNLSNGSETHSNSIFDLYGSGWRMDAPGSNTNWHVKANGYSTTLYGCGRGAVMRQWDTDNDTVARAQQGKYKRYVQTGGNHNVWDFDNYKGLRNLFKSTTGTTCNESNLYSSEIAGVLAGINTDFIKTAVIDKIETKVAPLYQGLPLANVKENDIIKIDLELLDNTDYQVAFMINGFPQGLVQNTDKTKAGCEIEGIKEHIQELKGSTNTITKTITINVAKTGVLFFKYGVTGKNMGRIKLPSAIKLIRQ